MFPQFLKTETELFSNCLHFKETKMMDKAKEIAVNSTHFRRNLQSQSRRYNKIMY
jgi:hypothetical protein